MRDSLRCVYHAKNLGGLRPSYEQSIEVAPHSAPQTCEDLEDAENLRHLFAIMRGAIMLNDTSLLETLLADDAVMVRSHLSVSHLQKCP